VSWQLRPKGRITGVPCRRRGYGGRGVSDRGGKNFVKVLERGRSCVSF